MGRTSDPKPARSANPAENAEIGDSPHPPSCVIPHKENRIDAGLRPPTALLRPFGARRSGTSGFYSRHLRAAIIATDCFSSAPCGIDPIGQPTRNPRLLSNALRISESPAITAHNFRRGADRSLSPLIPLRFKKSMDLVSRGRSARSNCCKIFLFSAQERAYAQIS